MRGCMNECWDAVVVFPDKEGVGAKRSQRHCDVPCELRSPDAESSAIGRNAKVNQVVHVVVVAHPVILGRRLCGGCVRWVGGLDCGCGCIRRGLVLHYCSRLYLWISI
jgi:hypothetical protein